MKMTEEQVKAFLVVLHADSPVKHHLEAILGRGCLPDEVDVAAVAAGGSNEAAVARVAGLVKYLKQVSKALGAHLPAKPRRKPAAGEAQASASASASG